MDIFNIEALISQGKVLTSMDIDPINDYVQIGKYVPNNRKMGGAPNSYESFAVAIKELGGLSSVSHDGTLTGLGTPLSPLSVVSAYKGWTSVVGILNNAFDNSGGTSNGTYGTGFDPANNNRIYTEISFPSGTTADAYIRYSVQLPSDTPAGKQCGVEFEDLFIISGGRHFVGIELKSAVGPMYSQGFSSPTPGVWNPRGFYPIITAGGAEEISIAFNVSVNTADSGRISNLNIRVNP